MTLEEAVNFYIDDKKIYIVKDNKEFRDWLDKIVKDGYKINFNLDEIQELIDFICNYYTIKYPDRELDYLSNGTFDTSFFDINSISRNMDTRQLLYRLPRKWINLLQGNYCGNCGYSVPVYDKNGNIIRYKDYIGININDKDDFFKSFNVVADCLTGKVKMNYELKELTDSEEINLEECLVLFISIDNNNLDYSELEKCLFKHTCDLELRKRILEMAALKILYSRNTTPENGHIRSSRMIIEFNYELGTKIDTEVVDNIMFKDYSSGEKNINKVDFKEDLKTYLKRRIREKE